MKKQRFKLGSRKARFLIAVSVILFGAGIFTLLNSAERLFPTEPGVKSKDVQVIGNSVGQGATLGEEEKRKVIQSKPIKADFQFNAIAPHWKEADATDENRTFEIRASLDKEEWSPWLEIEATGPLRDNDPHPDRKYAETPLMVDGKYFQYRITLSRQSLNSPTPKIYDLKINHIDSRKPSHIVAMEKVKGFFAGNRASAAQGHPNIISRSQWGSPDPSGKLFKGTDKYWPTSHAPVKQIFLHHTVTASYQSDPSAAVRAIWDFHANTRGWGDVGYNYLMDHHGNVYEGRLGGDNGVGGHVYEYNKGSMGVALLGCFESGNTTCDYLNSGTTSHPNAALQERLTNFLGFKSAGYEINPNTTHTFCNTNDQNCLNLWTIAGHRDAGQTSCPGDLTVESLKNIRNNTVAKKDAGWLYSAKQLSYNVSDLSSLNSTNVTLNFKNTGTTTWSNTDNKMMLYTMEPPGRSSAFQGSDWLSSTKPSLLNEASVSPGQTGTFTFNVRRPSLPTGEYREGFTLITQDGRTPGSHYILPIRFYCTIGQASNPRANGILIRDAGNKRVYIIESGSKRYIPSSLAAKTNGYNLSYIVDVEPQEISLLSDGEDVGLAEGTLFKSSGSPNVYILDYTDSGVKRRWITSVSAMSAFGMKFDQVQAVSKTTVDRYTEGDPLFSNSLAPDGRLIKSSNNHKVYLVKDGKSRWIPSSAIFNSHNYAPEYIGTVNQQKVDELTVGGSVHLRTGALVKTSSSATVYVIDENNGVSYRRPITTPSAFHASGFNSAQIKTISTDALNALTGSDQVVCHK